MKAQYQSGFNMSSKVEKKMDTVGSRIKQARVFLRITQAALAKKAGTTPQSWGKYEDDSVSPRIEMLKPFVELGISLNWLLTGQDEMLVYADEEVADDTLLPGDVDDILVFLKGEKDYKFSSELYKSDDFYKSIVDMQRQLIELSSSIHLGVLQSDEVKDIRPQIDSVKDHIEALEKTLKRVRSKKFKYHKEAAQYPEHSEKRAFFIWGKGCEKFGMPCIFEKSSLVLLERYKQKKISDAEMYDNALKSAKEQLDFIKMVNKLNSNNDS